MLFTLIWIHKQVEKRDALLSIAHYFTHCRSVKRVNSDNLLISAWGWKDPRISLQRGSVKFEGSFFTNTMAWDPFFWIIFSIINLTLLGLNFYQVFSFNLWFVFPFYRDPFGSVHYIGNAVLGLWEKWNLDSR